jgi:rubrerythrin
MAAAGRGRFLNESKTLFTALALIAAAIVLSGCGGGGDSTTTADDGGEVSVEATAPVSDEAAADIEVMNVALSQELTVVQVYRHSLRLLDGEARELVRQFLGQEEEHINAITKTMRGLQGETEGEVEEVDYSDVRSAEDALLQLYEITNLQLMHYIDDVAHLQTIAPRALVTTMAANEAQHLSILRQLLGAERAESVPEAFDDGEVPAP